MSDWSHFAINMHIVPFLSGATQLALCHVHHDFRMGLESFITNARSMFLLSNGRDRVSFAVIHKSRALCEMERHLTPQMDYVHMLYKSANRGNRELCILARKWRFQEQYRAPRRAIIDLPDQIVVEPIRIECLFYAAASCPNQKHARDICSLVRSWFKIQSTENKILTSDELATSSSQIRESPTSSLWARVQRTSSGDLLIMGQKQELTYYDMLSGALRAGNYEIGELALEWSKEDKCVIDFNCVYRSIDQSNSTRARLLCSWVYEMAKKNGQTIHLDGMLWWAAAAGNKDMCMLIHEWSHIDRQSLNYNLMIEGAIHWHKSADRMCKLCLLAMNWAHENVQLLDFNQMLHYAVIYGMRDFCSIIHEKIIEANLGFDYNGMLEVATLHKNRALCVLAREWALTSPEGDTLDYDMMFQTATRTCSQELCDLAREWKEIQKRART